MDNLSEKLKNLNFNQNEDISKKCKILKDIIDGKLQKIENFEKWFKEFGPFDLETTESVFKIFEEEFIAFYQRQSEDESDLKYSAVEIISKRCAQAKIRIESGDMNEALKYTAESSQLIKECIEKRYFSSIYGDGFRFIVDCLEIAIDQHKKDVALDKLKENLAKLENVDKFSNFDRVGGLALKLYFLGNLRRDAHDMQIELLKKVEKF